MTSSVQYYRGGTQQCVMGSLIDFQGYTSIGTIMTNAALLILDGTTMHRVLA